MFATTYRLSRASRAAATALVLAVVTLVAAPPAFAAPTLQVSATENLEAGQSITIEGSGFAPNLKGIAVGQCRVGYTGPSDCNLSGGATFRNADANGAIATVTVKLATSFGDIDCLKEQCIIAAAPLPTTSGPEEVAANTVEVPIYFGKAAPAAPAAAETTAAAAPAVDTAVDTAAPAATSAVLTSGDGDSSSMLTLLVLSNLVLAGAGLYLGLGRKKKAVAR